MRRLLALPLVAASLALAAPAHASFEVCTPTTVGACVTYTCVDICGPEVGYYTYCHQTDPATIVCPLYQAVVRALHS
ncbi:MAG TPA: hypothetical protein VFQ85_04600 [Mycobacteriales bacterium]|jgi:hypothetical protein|nr:hypothetical protein [Mycobacteriales bacterium]